MLNRATFAQYLFSLPERLLRSSSALAGGLVRELGEAALPAAIRRTMLYRTMVDIALRFLIEEVGQVEGVYSAEGQLAKDFLLRRTAGHGIELIGILAFHASPVWVMAALADLSGAGRQLIQEISESLKQQGLLDPDTTFENVDQLLDGLEKSAGHLAQAFNTPPIDVTGLRQELAAIREHVEGIPRANLPSASLVWHYWQELKQEAARQNRSVFELSSLVALSAIRRVPENLRWFSRASRHAARRAGQLFAGLWLDHFRLTLEEIREKGYVAYWTREFRPYLRAAASQLSPQRVSRTERLLRRWRQRGTET